MKRSEIMTTEKFEIEINTLKNFYKIYCKDKHENQEKTQINLTYKSNSFTLELSLCQDCQKAINYSFTKLQSCPHEIKPRCRKCPNPCYEKNEWKNIPSLQINLVLSNLKYLNTPQVQRRKRKY